MNGTTLRIIVLSFVIVLALTACQRGVDITQSDDGRIDRIGTPDDGDSDTIPPGRTGDDMIVPPDPALPDGGEGTPIDQAPPGGSGPVTPPEYTGIAGYDKQGQPIYYNQDECEAQGCACRYGMCDYIPQGQDVDDVCGPQWADGWRCAQG
ncbi:MAG: hypothetical protein ABIH41_05845 [Nanoarchaeota archaeon]